MFAYVDPAVKTQLLRDKKLFFIDEAGNACPESRESQPFLSVLGPVPMPVDGCQEGQHFRWYSFVRHSDMNRIEQVVEQARHEGPRMLYALVSEYMSVNSILVFGDFENAQSPLVRVHSNCLTGDVFGSLRCDCGPQLQGALEQIRNEGVGALVYMAGHEGRGIGLWAKAITYLLQDGGHDTYEANEKLGLPVDSRDFSDAGRIVRFFRPGSKEIRLLGNNPMKREAMSHAGLTVSRQEPLVRGLSKYNVRYLTSKQEHGHMIPFELLHALTHVRADQ